MPCPKCGKTGFEHRESHYSKSIRAHTYDWGCQTKSVSQEEIMPEVIEPIER